MVEENLPDSHLCHAPELAPALLDAAESAFPSGTGAARGAIAAGRELAAEAAGRVVAEDHVAGSTTADMVDGGGPANIALKLLVKAEDGAFGAAVDVASATTAGLEGAGDVGVQARQRGRTGSRSRVGGLGASQVDDIAGAAASRVQSWTAGMRDGRVRFNDPVIH